MFNDNDASPPLWIVTFSFLKRLTGSLPEKLSEALEDIATTVSLHNQEATDGDNWTITMTSIDIPDAEEIFRRIKHVADAENISGLLAKEGIIIARLPEKDWLQHVYDSFPPLKIGTFFVHDSYYKEAVPEDFIPLQIDAATAFGSGAHETTRGCIEALETFKINEFKNGLDMGCGSGILAIALAKLWPDIRVTAIDIDPESVVVTRRHAEMNNVSGNIFTDAGNGYQAPLTGRNAPYDIVTANILANPLIDMAGDLTQSLKAGGYAILSGLLARQRNDVVAAHEKQGLRLIAEKLIGDWQTLVLQKQ